MKHDDLLTNLWILSITTTELEHGAKAVKALREVIELHREDSYMPGEDIVCDYCKDIYPCDTIQVIAKEFGINE